MYTLEQRWEILWHYFENHHQKNHHFGWRSLWSWRICKQAKLSYLGHRKPARIHWEADALKTSHCLVRIFVQRHNWAIFLRKWARRGRCSQWRLLSGHVKRIFVHWTWRGGTFGFNRMACHKLKLHSMFCSLFEDRIISRRTDVVWSPHSYDLTPLDYYFWGAVKDKCYADKSETIDVLKDNIREAIDEIQLHTIDNMLKNLTDHVGYSMASHSFEWNYFPLLTGRIVLSNKKRNLRIFSSFFKAFAKKRYLADPVCIFLLYEIHLMSPQILLLSWSSVYCSMLLSTYDFLLSTW